MNLSNNHALVKLKLGAIGVDDRFMSVNNTSTISSIDLSGCPVLEVLECNGVPLKELDISDCEDLAKLNCKDNEITKLDISNNPLLLAKYLIPSFEGAEFLTSAQVITSKEDMIK